MRTRALSEAATATRRRVGVHAALLIPGLLLFVPARANPAEAHMQITSSSFTHQGTIPAKYTCEGSDTSPPLAWSGVPPSAKSLALIVDDPDAPDPKAPKMTWVHWVLYDVPPPELLAGRGRLPFAALRDEGRAERLEEDGVRRALPAHRTAPVLLQALRARHGPPNLGKPSKADLLKAMEGHVVGTAEMVGTYQKAQK